MTTMNGDKDSISGTVPPTEMLHMTYEGNFELECDAKVLQFKFVDSTAAASVKNGDDSSALVQVVLDKTTMHPQGGGQPTDIGEILIGEHPCIRVTKVTLDRVSGTVTHEGKIVAAVDAPKPVDGLQVHIAVDPKNRRILSECHTAGHVVDSAMDRCGRNLPPTKGYHFLDGPYVEYRGTIPPYERAQLVKDLQQAFQQLVREDIPTKIQIMSTTQAHEICNRIQDNFDLSLYGEDDIRVVTVAGWPCPCGGTHVRSTADLKQRKWGVIGIRSKKGIVRVRYGQNVE